MYDLKENEIRAAIISGKWYRFAIWFNNVDNIYSPILNRMPFSCTKANSLFVLLQLTLLYVLYVYIENKCVNKVGATEIKHMLIKNDNAHLVNTCYSTHSKGCAHSSVLLQEKQICNKRKFLPKTKKLHIVNTPDGRRGKGCKIVKHKKHSYRSSKERKLYIFLKSIHAHRKNGRHVFNNLIGHVEGDDVSDNVFGNERYINFTENSYGNPFLEINNNQADIPIDMPHFEREVKKVLSFFQYDKFSLTITLVNLKEMKNINRKRRNKNEPTDVISTLHFISGESNSSNANGGNVPTEKNEACEKCLPLNSGEIILCPKYINKQCLLSKKAYERKLHMLSAGIESNLSNVIKDDNTIRKKNGACAGIYTICKNGDGKEHADIYPCGINRIFQRMFSINERLPFYVIHGLIHLMRKDHENSAEEYKNFLSIEEKIIEKYISCHNFQYKQCYFSHYIVGMGTDILNVSRIYNMVLNKKKESLHNFLKRVLHIFEYTHLIENSAILGNAVKLSNYVSKKFAAKEAVMKSMGRGMSCISKYGVSMSDIEIKKDIFGKPEVYLYNKAKKLAEQLGIVKIFVSVSDEKVNCKELIEENSLHPEKEQSCYLIHAQALAVGSSA